MKWGILLITVMTALLHAGIVGGVMGVVLIMTASVLVTIIIIAVLVMRLNARKKDRTTQVK